MAKKHKTKPKPKRCSSIGSPKGFRCRLDAGHKDDHRALLATGELPAWMAAKKKPKPKPKRVRLPGQRWLIDRAMLQETRLYLTLNSVEPKRDYEDVVYIIEESKLRKIMKRLAELEARQ